MFGIWDSFVEWIREFLISLADSNLTTMFTDVNDRVGTIAAKVGKTPQGWNGSIYNLVRNLSGNVMMPIAGMIISLVLCYELISTNTSINISGTIAATEIMEVGELPADYFLLHCPASAPF